MLLQSAVYSESTKGAKMVPLGAPEFVEITDDRTPFRCTYGHISLFVIIKDP